MIDDNEFEDSPAYLDALYYGIKNNDDVQTPVDYLIPKTMNYLVSRPWDSGKWYDEDPDELRKILLKPIVNPTKAEFNHTLHPIAGSSPIMYGHLDTLTGSVLLLGFTRWSEFQDYIVDDSQPQARYIREELQADAMLNFNPGEVTFSYWLPRENKQTRPGYWALIITTPKERAIIHSIAGRIHINEVGLGIKNQVTITKEK
jgi:hypothetical protein